MWVDVLLWKLAQLHIFCRTVIVNAMQIIGFFVLTRVERIPRVIFVNAHTNPLRNYLLFTLNNRASWVFRKAFVRDSLVWINIRKEDGTTRCWFNMNACISKVCVTSHLRNDAETMNWFLIDNDSNDDVQWNSENEVSDQRNTIVHNNSF